MNKNTWMSLLLGLVSTFATTVSLKSPVAQQVVGSLGTIFTLLFAHHAHINGRQVAEAAGAAAIDAAAGALSGQAGAGAAK